MHERAHTHTQVQIPPRAWACNTIKVCLKTRVHGVISHPLFLQQKGLTATESVTFSVKTENSTASTAQTAHVELIPYKSLITGKSHPKHTIKFIDIMNLLIPFRSLNAQFT